MYFYVRNLLTGEYESGGKAADKDKCNAHVPEGCELIWSEKLLSVESQNNSLDNN